MLGAARLRPPAPTPLLPGALYARLDGLPLSRSKRRLARDFSDGGEGPEAEAETDLAGRTKGWGACEVLTTPEQGVRGAPEGEEAEMGPRRPRGRSVAAEGAALCVPPRPWGVPDPSIPWGG